MTTILETLKSAGWLREGNAIGGVWRDADNGARYTVSDPATGNVIGTIPLSGKAETRAAIDAAYEAFGPWSRTLASERAAALLLSVFPVARILPSNGRDFPYS